MKIFMLEVGETEETRGFELVKKGEYSPWDEYDKMLNGYEYDKAIEDNLKIALVNKGKKMIG